MRLQYSSWWHGYHRDPDPRVPSPHCVPHASATSNDSRFLKLSEHMTACHAAFRSEWSMSRPARSSRLHDPFLPHREVLPGPSPERDSALQELQRLLDMASRAWPPPECDLRRGLSKVKGSLQAGRWERGFSGKAAFRVGSIRGSLGPAGDGRWQVFD